jgi:excisionase family DNA binding protein
MERKSNHDEALRTVAETAKRLNVKDGTVRAWAAQRRFTYVKIGRALRIPEREIDRLIAASTIPAANQGDS